MQDLVWRCKFHYILHYNVLPPKNVISWKEKRLIELFFVYRYVSYLIRDLWLLFVKKQIPSEVDRRPNWACHKPQLKDKLCPSISSKKKILLTKKYLVSSINLIFLCHLHMITCLERWQIIINHHSWIP